MRLIDAEKIGEFASHYTEFDGKPLTEREKGLVKNVCGTISEQMPTAYNVDKVMEQMEEKENYYDNSVTPNAKFRQHCKAIATGFRFAKDIVKAGGIDEQS